MTARILVVEDEPDILRLVEVNLQREGYRVRAAGTAREALDVLTHHAPPDLVLLDLMLPDLSGTEVCRRIRADARTARVPVIMLTARSEEIDRVVGFTVGADDYVSKPFSVRELCLRVRAILRRTTAESGADDPISVGSLRFEPDSDRVLLNGEELHLTPLEGRLLRLMLRNRGRVLSRESLREEVWDDGAGVTLQAVDSSVKRLRRKLGSAGRSIETLRGVGYRFTGVA
ncbi:MAG: response regulator [Alphaproteobacteria bacterium]|nr:response regulator [Alphaproteobacteria bacterium]